MTGSVPMDHGLNKKCHMGSNLGISFFWEYAHFGILRIHGIGIGFKLDNYTTGSFFLNMTEPLNDPNIPKSWKKLQFLGTQKTKTCLGYLEVPIFGSPSTCRTVTIRHRDLERRLVSSQLPAFATGKTAPQWNRVKLQRATQWDIPSGYD